MGLCKFLLCQAQPLPFVFENLSSALCCNQTEGNCFIQVTLWRPESAVYSHERRNFNLDLYENGQWISLWYPEADAASQITSDPWRIFTFWRCLQWARVTNFKSKYLNQQHLHANVHYSGVLTHDPTVRAWRYHFAIKRYFMVNWLYPKIIGKEACRGKTNLVWHKMLALLDVSREEFKRLLCA